MKKRAMTLLEMMIVIFLIGTILSVIAYNMKGSLDKGKAFKTEQAISQIKDVLELEAANGNRPVSNEPEAIIAVLESSGIVKNPAKLMEDGWGTPLQISIDESGSISVTSEKYNLFKGKDADGNEKE